jgi:hypothetical protein
MESGDKDLLLDRLMLASYRYNQKMKTKCEEYSNSHFCQIPLSPTLEKSHEYLDEELKLHSHYTQFRCSASFSSHGC